MIPDVANQPETDTPKTSPDTDKSISWKPVPPPEWCRLPTESFRSHPFRSGIHLPPIFELDDDSRCSCGNTAVSVEIETGDLTIYTSTLAIQKKVETSYCRVCTNTKGRIGPDLGQYGVFNLNNTIAFSHELFNRYTSEFTNSSTPVYAFYQSIKDVYVSEESPFELCSVQLFTRAWFAFVQLQEISTTMECIQCGSYPSTVIADGISVAFPKHRIQNLRPPTYSDRSRALVKIPKRGIKQTCFLGSVNLRKSIAKALDQPDPDVGITKLQEILLVKEVSHCWWKFKMILNGLEDAKRLMS